MLLLKLLTPKFIYSNIVYRIGVRYCYILREYGVGIHVCVRTDPYHTVELRVTHYPIFLRHVEMARRATCYARSALSSLLLFHPSSLTMTRSHFISYCFPSRSSHYMNSHHLNYLEQIYKKKNNYYYFGTFLNCRGTENWT